MTTTEQPLWDRIAVGLTESDGIHGVGPGYLFGGVIAVAAGVGYADVLGHTMFPDIATYQRQAAHIKDVQTLQQEIYDTARIFRQHGNTNAARQTTDLAQTYNRQISAAEAKLPADYHPHIKGTIEAGGGIIVASLVLYSISKALSRWSNSVKAKTISD